METGRKTVFLLECLLVKFLPMNFKKIKTYIVYIFKKSLIK
jgi:hypothetical protein